MPHLLQQGLIGRPSSRDLKGKSDLSDKYDNKAFFTADSDVTITQFIAVNSDGIDALINKYIHFNVNNKYERRTIIPVDTIVPAGGQFSNDTPHYLKKGEYMEIEASVSNTVEYIIYGT